MTGKTLAGIVVFSLLFAGFLLFGFAQSASADCSTPVQIDGYTDTSEFDVSFSIAGNPNISIAFSSSTASEICSVSIYGRRATYIGTYEISIATDRYGTSPTVLASTTFSNNIFSTSDSWQTVSFPTPATLEADTTYYIISSAVSGATGFLIRWRASNNNLDLDSWWTDSSEVTSSDLLFKVNGNVIVPPSANTNPYVILSSMPSTVTCLTDGATTTCTAIQTDVVATNDFGVTLGIAYLLGLLIIVFLVYVFSFRKR